jgi:hypothetical protein
MMLDSSIGKILSTKPVEPSIPGNSKEPETKVDSVATTTKSEAEVRIVFRFFVEEQIVYNGKIEQVKQLESEELSRIVSRIAWDGAKEEKQPMLDKELIENGESMNIEEGEADNVDCHKSTADLPPSLDVTTKNNSGEVLKDVPGETSDIDCTPEGEHAFSHDNIVPIDTDRAGSFGKDPSNYNPKLTPEEQACVEAPPSFSYHICETNKQSNGSYKEEESNQLQLVAVKDQPHQEDNLSNVEAPPSLNEGPQNDDVEAAAAAAAATAAEAAAAAAESQMIVEALYDCVYNVDLECRKSNLASTVSNEVVSLASDQREKPDKVIEPASIKQPEVDVEVSKEVAKIDKKPLMEAVNVPPNQDITQETIPNSEDSYLKSKSAKSHQVCKDDLNLRTGPTKKSDIILASRRRNTCDTVTTTTRRIRRSGSKDLRASRNAGTDRLGENGGQNEFNREDVDYTGRYFANQSKVFAKWSDNHFYPGNILKSARDRKFEIGFFDGARKDVVETDLIPLSNILGKQVRVSIAKDYCVNAMVHDQVLNNGQSMFDVSYQQNGMVRKCVPLCDIFLTAEQGTPLISQPIRPDKNPDESMFAGVDLDNIVHNKRSRRLQEMEDLEISVETNGQPSNTSQISARRKRGQYNTRTSTNRARSGNTKIEIPAERGLKRSHSDANQDTPISSCSPDNIKPHLHSSNSNPPSESSSSTGSSNSAPNGHDIGQEFYFESTSPHRTKTSLLS